ncbi:OmpA family protein [Trinickia violacea]|uniref:OmpA family protein n=2 Tax=Trinickia violacea TaxID=2571746 RepID=A0A4P8J7B8_9BURK|nr:OmpA family protein [Trinickia violacea]
MFQTARAKFLVAAAVVLTGCTSASGPTYSSWSLNLPNGEKAYRVDCFGVFEGAETCQRKAREICDTQPVRVLQDMGPLRQGSTEPNTRELTFQCGVPAVASAPPPPPRAAPALPPSAPRLPERKMTFGGDANFDFDQAILKPEGRERLDKLIDEARGTTFDTVTANGYTDSVGRDKYNQALSERRAQSVVAYLKNQGLQSKQFIARGYGKASPIASNETAGGRSQNRRVEVSFGGDTK